MEYHIYIHNQEGKQDPTKPKPPESPKPTKPKEKKKKQMELSGNAISAGMIAAVKLAEKAVNAYDSFAASATGDYRTQVGMRNYRNAVNSLMNPVGAIINFASREHQNAIYNRKMELQRELLGDSMVSERTKKV